ncbi:hypothetical protein ACQJBY_052750 [Aegilops geniculata]
MSGSLNRLVAEGAGVVVFTSSRAKTISSWQSILR